MRLKVVLPLIDRDLARQTSTPEGSN